MPRLLPIVFAVVGFGLLAGGAIAYQDTRSLLDVAVEVPGRIVDITTSTSDGDTTYSPVYEYEVDGQSYRHESSVSSSSRPTIGETETMLIDPSDPDEAKADTFMDKWFLATLLGGLGAVFAGISTIILIVAVAGRRSAAHAESTSNPDLGLPTDRRSTAATTASATSAAHDPIAGDDDRPANRGPFL